MAPSEQAYKQQAAQQMPSAFVQQNTPSRNGAVTSRHYEVADLSQHTTYLDPAGHGAAAPLSFFTREYPFPLCTSLSYHCSICRNGPKQSAWTKSLEAKLC